MALLSAALGLTHLNLALGKRRHRAVLWVFNKFRENRCRVCLAVCLYLMPGGGSLGNAPSR